MFDGFDILKKLPDGGIVWIEGTKDLESTRGRIKQIASHQPGEYVIFSHQTQSVIAGPWASFAREMAEARDARERKKEAKKTKKKKLDARAKVKTSQVIADIVADIVRTVRQNEKRV